MWKNIIIGAIIFIAAGFVQSAPGVQQDGAGCTTPRGEAGRCVDVHACPESLRILAEVKLGAPEDTTVSWRHQQDLDNLRKSRCAGPHEYSVCCSLEEPSCGSFVMDRIIGNISAIDAYPWLAIIEYRRGDRTMLLCGGSLLNRRYVLTAAHCLHGKILDRATPTSVRLGDHDTSKGKDCDETFDFEDCSDPIQTIGIDEILVHPEFEETTRRNDIALIKLKDKANYTDFIRPVCLPFANVDLLSASMLPVAGWGISSDDSTPSNIKQHGAIKSLPADNCTNTEDIKAYQAKLTDKQVLFCTGGYRGYDKCFLDDGGPLMRIRSQTWQHEVVGVTSVLPKDCGKDGNAIFTKVYEYIDWIRKGVQPID